jgi:hypothetical protein
MFVMTPDQHRAVAKDLRRMVNDPKAQRLATAHEQLAVTIQKRLDERMRPFGAARLGREIARTRGLSDRQKAPLQ